MQKTLIRFDNIVESPVRAFRRQTIVVRKTIVGKEIRYKYRLNPKRFVRKTCTYMNAENALRHPNPTRFLQNYSRTVRVRAFWGACSPGKILENTAFSPSLAVSAKSINLIKTSASCPGRTFGVIDISVRRTLYRVRQSSEICGKNNK